MTDNLRHLDMMNYLQKSFLGFIMDNMTNDEFSVKIRSEFSSIDFEGNKLMPKDQIIEVYKRAVKEYKQQDNEEAVEEEKKAFDDKNEDAKTISD
jgi:hypothetical protein